MEKLAAAVQRFFGRFGRQDAQTMAEYAVILAVITLAILAALLLLSGNVGTVIGRVADFVN